MQIKIENTEVLGRLVRASRKSMKLRQDDTAGAVGVSENFLGKVERGSETVQWGKLFQVLQELGLEVHIELPEPFADEIQRLLAKSAHE